MSMSEVRTDVCFESSQHGPVGSRMWALERGGDPPNQTLAAVWSFLSKRFLAATTIFGKPKGV